MQYKMSQLMFIELVKELGSKKEVIKYVNEVFGLKDKILDIVF